MLITIFLRWPSTSASLCFPGLEDWNLDCRRPLLSTRGCCLFNLILGKLELRACWKKQNWDLQELLLQDFQEHITKVLQAHGFRADLSTMDYFNTAVFVTNYHCLICHCKSYNQNSVTTLFVSCVFFKWTYDGCYVSMLLKVEISPHCRSVLAKRMQDGVLPLVPVYDDVCTFRPTARMMQQCTGLTAGFPCQDS